AGLPIPPGFPPGCVRTPAGGAYRRAVHRRPPACAPACALPVGAPVNLRHRETDIRNHRRTAPGEIAAPPGRDRELISTPSVRSPSPRLTWPPPVPLGGWRCRGETLPGSASRLLPPGAENVVNQPAENSSPASGQCASESSRSGSRNLVRSSRCDTVGLLEKPLPRQACLPIHIPPEGLFHFRQKMLEMLTDRCYFRHRV